MTCRLQLASGEKLFAKIKVKPVLFAGVWRLGSLNPVTIAVDWVLSWFSGFRTAGLIQLWGLRSDDIGGEENWFAAMNIMFNLKQGPRTPLKALTDALQDCGSIAEVNALLAARWQSVLDGHPGWMLERAKKSAPLREEQG